MFFTFIHGHIKRRFRDRSLRHQGGRVRREDDTVANEKENKVLAFNAKQLSGVSGGTEMPPDEGFS